MAFARVTDDKHVGRLQAAYVSGVHLPDHLDPHLAGALRHVLAAPGNLSRPRVVVRMAEVFDLNERAADDLAMGLEYFHTASLLFDDLPCMDDADERRGVECVHRKYGEAGAILAALALVNRAYALIWRSVARCAVERQGDAHDFIETNLGLAGLINGQSLDLNYAGLPHDRQTTERIAFGKTVSLIRLSLVLPVMMGGASGAEIQMLERVARFWGFGYQILDDLKDVLESVEQSGKTGARDAALDRPNIALTIGVTAAQKRLQRLIELGDKALRQMISRRPGLAFLGTMRDDLCNAAASMESQQAMLSGRLPA